MAELSHRRTVVIAAVLSLVAGGGAVAWASSGGGAARYRTAPVTRGDVQQLLALTGTVSAAEQAKVRFRTSGTVSAVKVTVGETVARGQLLATMDTGGLQDAVTKATATLAKARATLESDSASTTTPTSAPTPSASPSANAKRDGSSLASVQASAARALQDAQGSLATATEACAAKPLPTSSPDPTASASATAVPTPTLTSSPTAPAARISPPSQPSPGAPSCADALQASLHAQQTAAAAQQQLAQALSSASSSGSTSRGSQTPSSSSTSSAQGSRSATSSAARITLDNAAVSAAEVALSQAQQNLDAVGLTAPIAGTVATIPWVVGGTASPSDALVILGTGPVDVTVDVPSSSIRSIVVGLPATVRVDGGTTSAEGTVTSIGLLPVSGSSSTTSYPVVVRVPAGAGLVDGSAAAVSIVVKTVKGVLTVPNSALHGTSVDVLAKGTVTSVRVETGAVGALVTQVTSGLTEGQTVVLADLSAALPTSSTTSNRFGGGFGGGGFGGGGFGGAGRQVVVRRGG